ncbi:TPA: flagellar hook-length control protein FliK [Candidatus Poribacteria bacterium]|nr:flagellar hook-length control protein FliK [Candidatus Poribacteria bacterium]HEX29114.1 flagellar hook-length control protein FliK [Candidatus Poribacteria bacterium]
MRLDRAPVERRRPVFYASNRSIEQFKSALKIGQILKGRVLYVIDDRRSLIRFLGFNVVTESQERFFRGQLVTARVVDIRDKVIMQLVRPQTTQRQGQGELIRVVSVDEILEGLGIVPDRFTRALVEAMIRYNMAIRADLVESMAVFLSEIGEPDVAEAVVLARLIGLPMDRNLIAALSEVIRNDIGGAISRLQNLISQLPEAEAQAIFAFLSKVSRRTEFREALEDFVRSAGLNYESALMKAVLRGNPPPQELRETLKGIILQLMEREDIPERFVAELESILRNLEGQQLLNLPRQSIRYDLPLLFLQIPVRIGDEFKTIYIKGYPDDKGRISSNNIKLDLLFETRNIGKIRVSLMMVERELTLRTWVENEEVKRIIEENSDRLISRMEDRRYRVSFLSCEVDPRRISDFGLLPPEVNTSGERKRVNLMA